MTENRPPIPRPVAQVASEWIVRCDGGPLSPEDEAAFQDWLQDPRHREALARLEVLWDSVTPQPAAPPLPPLRPAIAPRGRTTTAQPPRRRAIAATAVAASLALAVLGGLGDWPLRLRADHVTAVGERRTVVLADGSSIVLDSHSAVAVDFLGKQRQIRLLAGAALFDVAPDPARPFTVSAEGGSVTALGTKFAVREDDGVANVTVTEHRVRVASGKRMVLVDEGQQASFAADLLRGPMPADGAATAWTRGRLVVADRPLGEVVAEIARYRRGYIAVTGRAADLRVSGVYDLDHPLAAIASIEKSLELSSFRLGDSLIVLR